MSSVRVIKCDFKRVDAMITGQVTFEATFNETESRLGVVFQPALYVVPAKEVTSQKSVGGTIMSGSVWLDSQAVERSIPISTTFSAATQPIVTMTVPVSISVDSLFINICLRNLDDKLKVFFGLNAALDVRIELAPLMGAASGMIGNQSIQA